MPAIIGEVLHHSRCDGFATSLALQHPTGPRLRHSSCYESILLGERTSIARNIQTEFEPFLRLILWRQQSALSSRLFHWTTYSIFNRTNGGGLSKTVVNINFGHPCKAAASTIECRNRISVDGKVSQLQQRVAKGPPLDAPPRP